METGAIPHPARHLCIRGFFGRPGLSPSADPAPVTQMDNMLFSNMTLNPQPQRINAHFCGKLRPNRGRPLMKLISTLGLMIGISVNDTTVGTTIANLGMSEVAFRPLFEGDAVRAETEVLQPSRLQVAGATRGWSRFVTAHSSRMACWSPSAAGSAFHARRPRPNFSPPEGAHGYYHRRAGREDGSRRSPQQAARSSSISAVAPARPKGGGAEPRRPAFSRRRTASAPDRRSSSGSTRLTAARPISISTRS